MTQPPLGATLDLADRLQKTIDRLALELAHERAAHEATRKELDAARRQARTWRRVARWIFDSRENRGRHG